MKKSVREHNIPFNYKNVDSLTKEESDSLKFILGSNFHEHFNYKEAPILDFYVIDRIDKLFVANFSNGIDVSYIVSIADWSSMFFNHHNNIIKLLENTSCFRLATGFYNLKNFHTVYFNYKNHHPVLDSYVCDFYDKLLISLIDFYSFFNKSSIPIEKKEQSDFNLSEIKPTLISLYHSIKKDLDVDFRFRNQAKIFHNLRSINNSLDISDEILKDIIFSITDKNHIEENKKQWQSSRFIYNECFFHNINPNDKNWNAINFIIDSFGKDFILEQLKFTIKQDVNFKIHILLQPILYILNKDWSNISDDYIENIFKEFILKKNFYQKFNFFDYVDFSDRTFNILKNMNVTNKDNKEIYNYVLKNFEIKKLESDIIVSNTNHINKIQKI